MPCHTESAQCSLTLPYPTLPYPILLYVAQSLSELGPCKPVPSARIVRGVEGCCGRRPSYLGDSHTVTRLTQKTEIQPGELLL